MKTDLILVLLTTCTQAHGPVKGGRYITQELLIDPVQILSTGFEVWDIASKFVKKYSKEKVFKKLGAFNEFYGVDQAMCLACYKSMEVF
jgi:hypothetical protein